MPNTLEAPDKAEEDGSRRGSTGGGSQGSRSQLVEPTRASKDSEEFAKPQGDPKNYFKKIGTLRRLPSSVPSMPDDQPQLTPPFTSPNGAQQMAQMSFLQSAEPSQASFSFASGPPAMGYDARSAIASFDARVMDDKMQKKEEEDAADVIISKFKMRLDAENQIGVLAALIAGFAMQMISQLNATLWQDSPVWLLNMHVLFLCLVGSFNMLNIMTTSFVCFTGYRILSKTKKSSSQIVDQIEHFWDDPIVSFIRRLGRDYFLISVPCFLMAVAFNVVATMERVTGCLNAGILIIFGILSTACAVAISRWMGHKPLAAATFEFLPFLHMLTNDLLFPAIKEARDRHRKSLKKAEKKEEERRKSITLKTSDLEGLKIGEKPQRTPTGSLIDFPQSSPERTASKKQTVRQGDGDVQMTGMENGETKKTL